MAFQPPRNRSGFKVAIICALHIESSAVRAMFDDVWDASSYGKLPNDSNTYSTGRIGCHHVVLAHLSAMGEAPSASSTGSFKLTYPAINIAFVVGICGGNPVGEDGQDIVLGDVIISDSVVQHYGRRYPDCFRRKKTIQDSLSRPNAEIRAYLHKTRTIHGRKWLRQRIESLRQELLQVPGFSQWNWPASATDTLFDRSYRHKHQEQGLCLVCDACVDDRGEVCETALHATCSELGCNLRRGTHRDRVSKAVAQDSTAPLLIHFGAVASASEVMKSAVDRDRIAQEEGVIGFEMESSGCWDNFPTVVIKSVCDYADSHKNKAWQKYAAATAACAMKAFLEQWIPTDPVAEAEPKVPEAVETGEEPEDAEDAEDYEAVDGGFYSGQALDQGRWSHVSRSREWEKTRERLKNSLWFNEIRKRQAEVSNAHESTFQWIFETSSGEAHSWSEFVPWLEQNDNTSNVYWMSGKSGSGKSTLMNYVLHEPRTKAALLKWSGNTRLIVLDHFFWSFGSELQNSLHGLLRSFIFQTLEALPELISVVFPSRSENGRILESIARGENGKLWTQKELQQAFESLLRLEPAIRGSICLFIDGLDECLAKGYYVVGILGHMSTFKAVKLCISSRPLVEYLSAFRKGPLLRLHDLTRDDIQRFTMDSLLKNSLLLEFVQDDSSLITGICHKIVKKSEGVFLWVRIVVENVILGLLRRDGHETIFMSLDRLPEDIEPLYEQMLQRLLSQSQQKLEIAVMFQLLFILQSMGNAGLHTTNLLTQFAIAKSMALSTLAGGSFHLRDLPRLIKDSELRLAYLGAGFLEVDSASSTVRFFHKTALDFLSRPETWSIVVGPLSGRTSQLYEALLFSEIHLLEANCIHSLDISFIRISWFANHTNREKFEPSPGIMLQTFGEIMQRQNWHNSHIACTWRALFRYLQECNNYVDAHSAEEGATAIEDTKGAKRTKGRWVMGDYPHHTASSGDVVALPIVFSTLAATQRQIKASNLDLESWISSSRATRMLEFEGTLVYLQEKLLGRPSTLFGFGQEPLGLHQGDQNLLALAALSFTLGYAMDSCPDARLLKGFSNFAWEALFRLMDSFAQVDMRIKFRKIFRTVESPFITALRLVFQLDIDPDDDILGFVFVPNPLRPFSILHTPSAIGYQEIVAAFQRREASGKSSSDFPEHTTDRLPALHRSLDYEARYKLLSQIAKSPGSWKPPAWLDPYWLNDSET